MADLLSSSLGQWSPCGLIETGEGHLFEHTRRVGWLLCDGFFITLSHISHFFAFPSARFR